MMAVAGSAPRLLVSSDAAMQTTANVMVAACREVELSHA